VSDRGKTLAINHRRKTKSLFNPETQENSIMRETKYYSTCCPHSTEIPLCRGKGERFPAISISTDQAILAIGKFHNSNRLAV
jgi:hypothetical protein